MPQSIHLHYVAMLKDRIGSSTEIVETDATDLKQLYAELSERYQLPWPDQAMRPAVNDQMAQWDTRLHDGDHVIFLPPASGG